MVTCEVLLFVATETELAQLERAALERGACFEPIDVREHEMTLPRKIFRLGTIGADRVIAVKTGIGAIGDQGSAALGLRCMQKTHATTVICDGMAFGVSQAYQAYGDVLISDSLFPYDDREVVPTEDGGWKYAYGKSARVFGASPEALRLLNAYRPRVTGFRIHSGCMLSGNARIRSASFRDDLLRWSKNVAKTVVGGEMEGFGLLSLARPKRPNWVVVEGICDFAGDNQIDDADRHRQIACSNAASFVLGALADGKPTNG